MKLFTPSANALSAAPVSRLAAGAVLLLAVAGTVGATSAMEPAAHRSGTNVVADDPWTVGPADDPWTVAPAAKADDPWT